MVVGQLNLGHFIDSFVGYVSVFYAVPKRRGFASARLSMTPSNVRAERFYLRRGWQDLGP